MKIVNNILYGDTINDKPNSISKDELASDYEYITKYSSKLYLKKISLSRSKYLTNYTELLLILTQRQGADILNLLFIPRWETNSMVDNYQFNNASWKVEREINDIYFYSEISFYDRSTI